MNVSIVCMKKLLMLSIGEVYLIATLYNSKYVQLTLNNCLHVLNAPVNLTFVCVITETHFFLRFNYSICQIKLTLKKGEASNLKCYVSLKVYKSLYWLNNLKFKSSSFPKLAAELTFCKAKRTTYQ